ncbi:MAG: hypothetical protein ABH859_08705 [Pseudomonadota bacterium]
MKKILLNLILCCLAIFIFTTACKEPIDYDKLPPESLIKNNIKETDLTAKVHVTFFQEADTIKTDAGKPGYIVYKIDATNVKCYKGDLKKQERFSYYETREAGIPRPLLGGIYYISLKKNDKGEYYVPDNGYAFLYERGMNELYKKASQ